LRLRRLRWHGATGVLGMLHALRGQSRRRQRSNRRHRHVGEP